MAFGKKNPAQARRPAKGKRSSQKGLRGKMPVKRSINLAVVDVHKISVLKAVPSILLVIALAAAFSKFLVADRLIAMSGASDKVSKLKTSLEMTTNELTKYEGIEDKYAHLTYAGMNAEEIERVDRVRVLELVSTIFPEDKISKSWSVSGNILTVDVTASSLQAVNELARKIEQSPIVDTCMVTTARKDEQKTTNQVIINNDNNQSLASALESRRQMIEGDVVSSVLSAASNLLNPLISEEVKARFTIYLCQPPETEETGEDAETGDAPSADAAAQGEQADEGAQAKEGPAKPIRSAAAESEAGEVGAP